MARGENKAFKEKQGRLKNNREEARAMGQVGGVASGEAKRRRKSYRELLMIKDQEVGGHDKEGNAITKQSLMLDSLMHKAADGDVKAMELVLQIAGEAGQVSQQSAQVVNIGFASKEMAETFTKIVEAKKGK